MEEFEAALVKLFNEYSLPFELKRYVLKHVMTLTDIEVLKQKQKEEQPNEQVSQ
jgi:hypothetical protein